MYLFVLNWFNGIYIIVDFCLLYLIDINIKDSYLYLQLFVKFKVFKI